MKTKFVLCRDADATDPARWESLKNMAESEMFVYFRRTFVIRTNELTRKLAVSGLFAMAALIVIGSRPAQAQQSETEALRAEIEALTARLDTLEQARNASSDATKAAPPATARFPIVISGLLQAQYANFSGENGAAFPRQQSTFRLRRAEMRITAPAITDRISGTVQFDFARGVSSSAAQGQQALTTSASILQELQLSYLLKKASAQTGTPTQAGATSSTPLPDNIYVDVGQFKLPIGYEGDLVSSAALQTIERALLFRARDFNGGGRGDIRDTGLQLRGTLGGNLDYRLGVFNGLGERQDLLSTGNGKAIVARLMYRPRSLDGLQVGVSGAQGNTSVAQTSLTTLPQRFNRNVYTAFAVYKKNKITFQNEYGTGHDQNRTSGLTGVAARERKFSGYYSSLGYLFTSEIEGVLRYDYFKFDRNVKDTGVRELTAGINYYIKGNNAKIQANIVRVQGAQGLTAANGFGGGGQGNGFQNDRTEFRLQGQVSF